MFDIVLDTLMLPIEREVAADIRKRLSSLSWRPNQIAVIRIWSDSRAVHRASLFIVDDFGRRERER